eukprot:scaffold3096_cov403-Prasinococcus_capsulatus_cf.AAC.15
MLFRSCLTPPGSAHQALGRCSSGRGGGGGGSNRSGGDCGGERGRRLPAAGHANGFQPQMDRRAQRLSHEKDGAGRGGRR